MLDISTAIEEASKNKNYMKGVQPKTQDTTTSNHAATTEKQTDKFPIEGMGWSRQNVRNGKQQH